MSTGKNSGAGVINSGTHGSYSAERTGQLINRIESIPFSRWHIKPRLIIGSATFFDAFDALSLSYALPVLIGLWSLKPSQTGLLISSGYLGQAIGAILFGTLAEKYGRLFSAKWTISLMSIMSFVCIFAGNFNMLFAARFVQGIAIGGEVPVAAAYVNELSRAHGRGRFFMLYEMIFPIGLMMTGQIGTLIVPTLGWKWMFIIGGVAGLIITFLMQMLPESPRWLISKGRYDEAEKIIEKIEASTDVRVPVANYVPKAQVKASWKELFSPFYRGRTLVVWSLWFSVYFVSNGLNNWLPSLYKTVYKLPLQEALRAASFTNVAQVVLVIACAFLIDKIGRKKWAAGAFAISGCLLVVLFLTGAKTAQNVMIYGTLAYGVIGSAATLLYLYTPEIYPTRMRAIGTAFATAWLRLASALGPIIVGYALNYKGISFVFAVFAAVSILGVILATRMIETREKMLEEIAP